MDVLRTLETAKIIVVAGATGFVKGFRETPGYDPVDAEKPARNRQAWPEYTPGGDSALIARAMMGDVSVAHERPDIWKGYGCLRKPS